MVYGRLKAATVAEKSSTRHSQCYGGAPRRFEVSSGSIGLLIHPVTSRPRTPGRGIGSGASTRPASETCCSSLMGSTNNLVARSDQVGSRGYVLPCWTFPSSVLASFRASSTANPRMYAVTERPAERARRDNRSTSRAMFSAFVAGSCRQNSTSLAMTPTHATGLDLHKFTPNELTSQTLRREH
jgi:hypothetical protein